MKKDGNINYIKKVNVYRPGVPLWVNILLKSIFITFIICCLFVAVFSFIYICTPVSGKSMLPTLNAQCYDENGAKIEDAMPDSVYINRFASYDYGNIIVVNNPTSSTTSKYVIKRLIAKGGDKVAVVPVTDEISELNRTYKIFLIKSGTNQTTILEEPYLAERTSLLKTYQNLQSYQIEHPEDFVSEENSIYGIINYLIIEEDEFFYLGDNRSDSTDCSKYGPVKEEKYVGRVDIIAYESTNNFSQIFLYFWHKIFG